jgi:hypothetical protein
VTMRQNKGQALQALSTARAFLASEFSSFLSFTHILSHKVHKKGHLVCIILVSMLSQSLAPAEKQAEERQALQAIFADDFQQSVVDESSFKISLRAYPLSVVLAFEMPPQYPLEPVSVSLEQVLGLSIPEEAALKQAVVSRAASCVDVFAIATEAQDWMSACLDARASAKRALSSGSEYKSSDADLELQKKIAHDLKRKKDLLLKTPESDWMHHVSPPPNADSIGEDFEDEEEEANKDSLDDDDDDAADGTDHTSSSSDRHNNMPPTSTASSNSYPRLPIRSKATTAATTTAAPTATGIRSPPAHGTPAHLRASAPALSAAAGTDTHPLRWKLGQVMSESENVRFYQAMNLETGSTMALRQITFPSALSRNRVEQVEKMTRYLQRLSSPHLVPCRGFEWTVANVELVLFLPDLRGGSLESLLKVTIDCYFRENQN